MFEGALVESVGAHFLRRGRSASNKASEGALEWKQREQRRRAHHLGCILQI
jgi:hypothetical protein